MSILAALRKFSSVPCEISGNYFTGHTRTVIIGEELGSGLNLITSFPALPLRHSVKFFSCSTPPAGFHFVGDFEREVVFYAVLFARDTI